MVFTLVNLELQVTFLLGDIICWFVDVEMFFWYWLAGVSWWPSRLSWDPGSPSIILTQSLLIWFISSCQEYPAFLFLSNVDRKSSIKSVWSRFLEWHFLKFLCSIFLWIVTLTNFTKPSIKVCVRLRFSQFEKFEYFHLQELQWSRRWVIGRSSHNNWLNIMAVAGYMVQHQATQTDCAPLRCSAAAV